MKKISILIIIFGALLLIVGIQFTILKWPDMFYGIYSGPVVIVVGLVLLIVQKIKK